MVILIARRLHLLIPKKRGAFIDSRAYSIFFDIASVGMRFDPIAIHQPVKVAALICDVVLNARFIYRVDNVIVDLADFLAPNARVSHSQAGDPQHVSVWVICPINATRVEFIKHLKDDFITVNWLHGYVMI